mgnify:CR=1 FL=1
MYSIIGSGFGLYGYLPAIIKLNKKGVVLPEEYKKTILARPELQEFERDITWTKNKADALKKTTELIIALPPSMQYSTVKKIINETKIKKIYLEKPLAPTPEKSKNLLKLLNLNELDYVIGYSFLYLNLQAKFNDLIAQKDDINFNWFFMADHFSKNLKNWKRYHDLGGGVLRFYGIHLIAFLSLFGYKNVVNSTLIEDNQNEPYIWKATITGEGLPVCNLKVDCRSDKEVFSLSNLKLGHSNTEKDPFDVPTKELSNFDRRVSVLMKTLSAETRSHESLKLKYADINELWIVIEKATNTIQKAH